MGIAEMTRPDLRHDRSRCEVHDRVVRVTEDDRAVARHSELADNAKSRLNRETPPCLHRHTSTLPEARQQRPSLGERAHLPLPFPVRAPLEQRPHLHFDLLDALLQRVAVAVLLELLPSVEDVPGDLQPVQTERFLRTGAEVGVER